MDLYVKNISKIFQKISKISKNFKKKSKKIQKNRFWSIVLNVLIVVALCTHTFNALIKLVTFKIYNLHNSINRPHFYNIYSI